ncbi:hypothetical protein EXIGLDRAFT_829783 [Exidia glandulosa HHB12029]|uniref:Peptidase S54 rhomboid domain-containing protein n=1 Tax=Exidia glandulosa HHB12029 TaxID=1314781 RepID=A0A165PA55_EXIGL|nr:hypothetical protein EXIGLDRAFT_829783 [Exidia glandulosa HHB12029]
MTVRVSISTSCATPWIHDINVTRGSSSVGTRRGINLVTLIRSGFVPTMFKAARHLPLILQRPLKARQDFILNIEARADTPICRSPRILRRVAVFLGISCTIVGGAAWVANELDYARLMEHKASGTALSPETLRIQRHTQLLARWADNCKSVLPASIAGLVDYPHALVSRVFELNPIGRTLYFLLAANVFVYAISLTPRGAYFVIRYMTNSGLSGKTYTAFTSIYTHMGPFHLGLNMLGLYAGLAGLDWMGKQDGPWTHVDAFPKLVAFWTVAGGFGIFVPTLATIVIQRRGLQWLPQGTTVYSPLPEVAFSMMSPCVGASVSVYALLMVEMLRLDSVHPQPKSPGGWAAEITPLRGFAAVLLAEAAAVPFIHSGFITHLAGAAFGYCYFYWGQDVWEWARRSVGNRGTYYVQRSPPPNEHWSITISRHD